MAIVKMNKFTLLSFGSQKEKLLEELQSFSHAQFINLQDEDFLEKNEGFQGLEKEQVDSGYVECDENLSKAKSALEFAERHVPKKSGLQSLKEEKETLDLDALKVRVEKSNWENAYSKVREKEVKLAELETKTSSLAEEIEVVAPWKGFDAPFNALKDLKKAKYFLGTLPKQYEESLEEFRKEFSKTEFELINSGNQEVYIFALSHEDEAAEVEERLKTSGFTPFNSKYEKTPAEALAELEKEVNSVKEEITKLIQEVAGYTEELKVLQLAFEYFGNLKERMVVSENFLKTEKTVVMQGWVPVDKNEQFTKAVKNAAGSDFYLDFSDVKEEEISDVPVKLKNNFVTEVFESVTEMYSLPRYDEVDPTPLMMPFYLLFFGMMVADVGYGLVMLVGALIAMKLFKNNKGNSDFAKFFAFLSIPTMLFGFIYGSFFSDFVKIPALINPSEDVNTILIMAIVFGVVQIFVGLGVKAYSMIKKGDYLGAFYDVGAWILILVGIAALFVTTGPAKIVASTVSIGAAIVIILTGGRTEETKAAQIGQGFYALYGITGYIGDLVSYTRLMALGLAGGSIAGALNLLIRMLPGGFVGIIFTAIAFIAAHTFNLLLGLLGAYVHTARLQYVEYFSKFYEGGGKPFVPFRALNKYINLTEK